MALRQNVTGATAGNKSLCRQRISVASIPDWMRTGSTDPNNTGLEFAVAAMFFGATELTRQERLHHLQTIRRGGLYGGPEPN